MKKLLMLAALILIATLVGACTIVRGSGTMVTEAREVRNFDRVSISGSGEIVLTQGENESLTIEADANLMQYMKSDVRGGTLHLDMDSGVGRIVMSTRRPKYVLTMIDINGLEMSGSAAIDAGTIDTTDLEITISGSGSVGIATLMAKTLRIDISGSGSVNLAGEVVQADIETSGSGVVRAGDLRSESADVSISGSGSTTVWATDSLDANLAGSGSLSYYGNPSMSTSASGSGTIKGLGEE